ncbi:Bacteriophytochrome cph2 [Chromobacterium violaceum]|uniref:Bacteriophytochrome cph2 n=1 Tax=Chromobacterium violaceum TaxID=536 RepID=A0A447TLU8_CHRVL|nr:Bacteriophytochrome cph2 [Chromobacterium violaceum]
MFGMDAVDECEVIARRIVSEFERPVVLAGREVFSTASVGVVLADSEHYHKADDLLRDADHAMYCTKQQGRQGYTLFSHQLRIDQADQLALETELRRALEEEGQLVPYYQPFIAAATGALAGFETLVRWQHPQRGLVSPGVFLPVAEESGLITRLDRYMINAACAQLQAWRAEGRVGEGIALHINLSSANFRDPDLVGWIGERIAHYRLPPAMLHLEITESALIDQPEAAATAMQALHGLGVRLALDDFGTGYSALSYLHRYRFDVLKIDQSFVFDLDRKQESVAIVRAILALARALDLEVVAEGVETASQSAMLKEMGCGMLQGFHFVAPAPAWALDWDKLARFAEGRAVWREWSTRFNRWRYDLYAPVYDKVAQGFARHRRRAIGLLNPQPDERVLLVGAGTGLDLDFLVRCRHVAAIDIAPAMLARLRERAGKLGMEVDARVMDGQRLDFPTAASTRWRCTWCWR